MGKNRVMTAVHLGLRASPSEVQMDISRVEKDRTRCEEVFRGSKGLFGVEVGTSALSSRAVRDDGARGPTLKCVTRPFALISSLFLPFRSLDPTSPSLLFYSYLAIRDSD